jgi:DNA-binding PadR family transcriptional regulator
MSPRPTRRSGLLEFAVLGLLHEQPLHGYELRKRLGGVLGPFHAISYGSLYPCLKQLVTRDLIIEDAASAADSGASALSGRRARIAYTLTADGKEYFAELVAEAGPETWEDDRFGVHFAFFGRTAGDVRLRILEGRRSRLEERMASLRAALGRTRERMDDYTLELQQHGLESVEREVRWLGDLIDHEHDLKAGRQSAGTTREANKSGATTPSDPVEDTSGAGHRPTARG